MNFMNRLSELGNKVGNFYGIARKGLDTVVSLGHKAKHLIQSEPVQDIIGLLPTNISTPLGIAGRIGDRALTGLESLQSKLNTGEAMAGRVKGAFDSAKRTFELPRQMNAMNSTRLMEQGAGLRIPSTMITGGSQRQTINSMTGVPPVGMMSF